MDIAYSDDEHDPRFVEACFFTGGEVAVLSLDGRSVSVNMGGHPRAVHLDYGTILDSSHQFRSQFPDGVTDQDDWEWQETGSFTLGLLSGEDSDWETLPDEYATLDEAVESAIEILAH